MNGETGINQIQEDLGKALANKQPLAMFGSGNPAHIPAVSEILRNTLADLVSRPDVVDTMLGNYDGPQGNIAFIRTLRDFMNRHYHLGITNDNIAITSGSQSGYFMLFNMLAGRRGHAHKKILFPMVPEYVGYLDQSLEPGEFIGKRPEIKKIGDHTFEYVVDLHNLYLADDIAAMCLSRPTNPTGNVVTDEELHHLGRLAAKHDIPLIIDNAYGIPFPNIVVPQEHIFWNDHTIHSLTLSKIGLPSMRIGIFIGPVPLMQALSRTNAVVNLASPSMGEYLMNPLLEHDEILRMCERHIKPHYLERAHKALALINAHFPPDLPWRFHEYQGSYFLWLWLENAKKTSKEVYEYLRQKDVLVAAGDYFFPGSTGIDWRHAHECVRLNFARPDLELERGIPVLADAVTWAYR